MTQPPDVSNLGASTDAEFVEVLNELVERAAAGELLDTTLLIQQYAGHADQLRELLPTIQAMTNLRLQDAAPLPHQQFMGDFRIRRQIGRGGMGIVYEAEQLSLGRRVALKVLPFAAMLDENTKARFKNEARAAALLDHPHIVDVYGVGCENDVHYYAMRFIDGCTLAEIVSSIRISGSSHRDVPITGFANATNTQQAAPKSENTSVDCIPTQTETRASNGQRATAGAAYYLSVAELGITIADALEHAHQRGVIHRDIKPSNLILDSQGKIWVTDFGLALVDTAATLTRSGAVVGTLAYMSPEQARGAAAVVDHRTDVYSLGVTLYELACLQPAFADHQRKLTLQRVIEDHPPRLRRIEASIPRDLETIIGKAMSKAPPDRYETAAAMAEDLRRFATGAPIQARPVNFVQSAVAWARHHAKLVLATFCGMLLTIIALAVGVAIIWNAQRDRLIALKRAERQLELTYQAADEMYLKVAEDWLQQRAGLADMQRDFLSKASSMYAQLEHETQSAPHAQSRSARAAYRLGIIEKKLARPDAAKTALSRSIKKFEHLHRQSLLGESDALLLAQAYSEFAGLHFEAEQIEQAQSVIRRAAQWLGDQNVLTSDDAQWLRRFIAVQQGKAADPSLGAEQRRDLLHSAVDASRRVRALGSVTREDLIGHIAVLRNYAMFASMPDKPDRNSIEASRLAIEEAVTTARDLVRQYPAQISPRQSLGHTLIVKSANIMARFGETDLAGATEAVEVYEDLVEIAGDLPGNREMLAGALINRGNMLPNLDDQLEAFDRAARILDELCTEYPEELSYRNTYAIALFNHANMLDLRGDFQSVIRLRLKLKSISPQDAGNLRLLGVALYNMKRTDEARDELIAALAIDPSDAKAHFVLGRVYEKMDESSAALASYEAATKYDPNYAEAYCYLGRLLCEQGMYADALGALEKGHTLGSQNSNWNLPSAEWLERSRQLSE